MIPIIIFLLSTVQKQLAQQPVVLDGAADAYASEFIFISSPYGIYTFDRNSEKWSRITTTSGLPDNDIDIIGLDDGILWVITSQGLASADIRINDWVTYEDFGAIRGLGFDDEYIWIGGDSGIKRLDKYVETWDDISVQHINDMFSEKEDIWLATDSGIIKFDREFEKLEKAPGAPELAAKYIINTPNTIWFLADEHFAGYKKSTEHWSEYPGMMIHDYASVGDSLFVVSSGQVFLYEPKADYWLKFRDIEDLPPVNGIFVDGQDILFATNNGLIVYTYIEKKRKLYNRSNGLENDSLIDAYQDSKYIFTINNTGIEYYDKTSDIWAIEKFRAAGEKRQKILYIDEAGGHLQMINGIDIRLQGRAYYSELRDLNDAQTPVSDYENINLKLIWQHTSNRILSSYYDDTDKDQKTYGFGYRGLSNDFIYRVNGGYLESDYFEFDLIPQYSTLGGNAKLRYKKQTLGLQVGELKSTLRNDFFTGKTTDRSVDILDVSYRKNIFYYIYGVSQMLMPGNDTIFVDDQNPYTNTIDTRSGFTIAGISGDFDPLINGLDYYIDYRNGIIHFLMQRSASEIIAIKINGQEMIIQTDSIPGVSLENVYLIGPDIIPNSLVMTIIDTLGQNHALSDFGLDNDNDGLVDVEYVNHDLGLLIFPDPRPFPDQVYDDTLNIYTLHFNFRSLSTFYYLSYQPLLKMSEKVYVDGDLLTRGSDYVVDYTSGILLFLKEELVSDFSEIEVQYSSVERTRDDFFYSAQPNINIRDGMNIAPGFTNIDGRSIGHISAKLQLSSSDDMSIKYIPQAAVDDGQNWVHKHELLTNYRILSVNAAYHAYSDSFDPYGLSEKKYGRLEQEGKLSIDIEPIPFVILGGQFKRDYLRDSLQGQRTTQHIQGRISYLDPKFINGYIQMGRDELPDYEKDRILFNGRYNFKILKTSMKLNSIIRHIQARYSDNNEKSLTEYIFQTNFSLPFPVQADIYFRNNDFYERAIKEKNEQEIRGTINMDFIPGIYYTGNYNLRTWTYFFSVSKELALENYFYNNVNIAPGRWYAPMSMINFSLGYGKIFGEYIRDLDRSYEKPYFLIDPLEQGTLSRLNNTNNYYITLQFTPLASLLIWARHGQTNSGLAYYDLAALKPFFKDEVRVEYEPSNLGLFITSWDRRMVETYPEQTVQNIYFEWSKPWSQLLRTKLTTNYRINELEYIMANTDETELKAGWETLLRLGSKSYFVIDLGASRQETVLGEINYSVIPGASVNVNLLKFLYLQINYESNFMIDSTSTHLLSTRITGQF